MLSDYIFHARTPEEIADDYDSLSLEQVYATVLYYLHNKEQVHAYMTEWEECGRRMWEEQQRNPTPVMLRLRKLRAEGKLPCRQES